MISLNPPCIIIQWPWFYKSFIGLSVWPFVFVKDKTNRTCIEHEKIHIRQQLRGLLVIFYVRYFYYLARYGYRNNPFEIEAYAHQDDWKNQAKGDL